MTLLPEFHDQLYAAARGHARRRRPRPRIALPRRMGTFAVTGLSSAVAIAVAVVVLSAHGVGPGGAPGSGSASVASSRAELLRTLAVLRTPQTAADRHSLPSGFFGLPSGPSAARLMKNPRYRQILRDQGYPQIDHSLVRMVGLVSGGALTLVPMTFRQTTLHGHGFGERDTVSLYGPRVEGLALALRLPGTDGVALTPSTVGALQAHGLNLFTYVHHQNTGVVIVPDGVTNVSLSDFRVTSRVHVDPTLIPAVTASVHNNIALFHVVAPTVMTHGGLPGEGASGIYSTGAYARMTWLGPQGQILNRTTINIAFSFIAQAQP